MGNRFQLRSAVRFLLPHAHCAPAVSCGWRNLVLGVRKADQAWGRIPFAFALLGLSERNLAVVDDHPDVLATHRAPVKGFAPRTTKSASSPTLIAPVRF